MNRRSRTQEVPHGVDAAAWAQRTPFEQAVYRTVAAIPRGQTRSYGWVARRLGRPGAARAVGNALHGNPFAPRIPCHRVVKADGTLGGFADGPRRKAALLRAEGARLSRA